MYVNPKKKEKKKEKEAKAVGEPERKKEREKKENTPRYSDHQLKLERKSIHFGEKKKREVINPSKSQFP